MNLIKYPDPILLTKSKSVEITEEVKDFIAEMIKIAEKGFGWGVVAGLAAPQLGKNWRIFLALGELYINPEIIWRPAGGEKFYKEGCFSLEENKFDYKATRSYAIKMKWQDLKGNWHENKFTGDKAQVIQHEYDHLEGKICGGIE